MRKLIIMALGIFCTAIVQDVKAQCDPIDSQPLKVKFTGVAPSPWAINGLVDDWVTLLGPGTGNNSFPYNPTLPRFNFSMDPPPNLGSFLGTDHDSPEPASDIRLAAFTHDDYNVYFYLRRLAASNSPNFFYYFCDINADGYMNSGEPVFGGRFNTQNVSELAVYSYIPNVNEDYVPGKGNWMVSPVTLNADGYTIKGSLQKVFNSHAIPANVALGANEVFDAEVTENGYGVEFAIPWKFFRNWVTQSAPLTPNYIFTYHVSMQKGATPNYQSQLVKDNVGSCCDKLLYSGNPLYTITNTTVTTLVPGLSYRLQVPVQNLTNVEEIVELNAVNFFNIQLNDGLPFSPSAFSVVVNGVNFQYLSGTLLAQPISYGLEVFENNGVTISPFGTTTFRVDISLPANHSVSQVSVGLNLTNARFSIPLAAFIYCVEQTGGGKGINPVGFDITTEEESQRGVPEKVRQEQNPAQGLKVYPNPSKGSATVILPVDGRNGEIRLEDVSGRLIYRRVGISGATLPLENLRPGIYVLRFISSDTGKQYLEKLIVQ